MELNKSTYLNASTPDWATWMARLIPGWAAIGEDPFNTFSIKISLDNVSLKEETEEARIAGSVSVTSFNTCREVIISVSIRVAAMGSCSYLPSITSSINSRDRSLDCWIWRFVFSTGSKVNASWISSIITGSDLPAPQLKQQGRVAFSIRSPYISSFYGINANKEPFLSMKNK